MSIYIIYFFYLNFNVSSATEPRTGFGRDLCLKIHLFQHVTLCHWVCVSWRFEGSCYRKEGTTILAHTGYYSPIDTASHRRRTECPATPL
jgi:hypothetical protein